MAPRPPRRTPLAMWIPALLAVALFALIIVLVITRLSSLAGAPVAALPEATTPASGVLQPDDERRIGFMSNRDGNWELYELTLGTRAAVNLTNNPADDGFASYSADGGAITFISNRDRAAEGELTPYMMDADGGNQRRVANDLPTIMSLLTTGRFNWDFRYDAAGAGVLVSLRDLNLEVYRLTRAGDGSAVETNLSQSGGVDWFPALDPTGRQIVFSSDREGSQDIYLMPADASAAPRRLTDDPADDVHAVWLTDLRHIVYYSERGEGIDGGRTVLYQLDTADPAAQPVLLQGGPVSDDGVPLRADVQFASDGSAQVYMAHDGQDWEIYYAGPGGENPVRLTDNSADDLFPAWR